MSDWKKVLDDIAEKSSKYQEAEEMVNVEGKHITFKKDGNEFYWILLEDLENHFKIMWWYFHLRNKNWANDQVLYRFVKLACETNNLEFPETM